MLRFQIRTQIFGIGDPCLKAEAIRIKPNISGKVHTVCRLIFEDIIFHGLSKLLF